MTGTHVHTTELRPHLQRGTQPYSPQDARLEQVSEGFGTLCPLEVDLVFDFLEFENDEVILLVASTVEIRKNLKGFYLPEKRMSIHSL